MGILMTYELRYDVCKAKFCKHGECPQADERIPETLFDRGKIAEHEPNRNWGFDDRPPPDQDSVKNVMVNP